MNQNPLTRYPSFSAALLVALLIAPGCGGPNTSSGDGAAAASGGSTCPVGTWTSTAYAMPGYNVLEGGGGAALTIEPDLSGTLDYGGTTPIVSRPVDPPDGPEALTKIEVSGVVQFQLGDGDSQEWPIISGSGSYKNTAYLNLGDGYFHVGALEGSDEGVPQGGKVICEADGSLIWDHPGHVSWYTFARSEG